MGLAQGAAPRALNDRLLRKNLHGGSALEGRVCDATDLAVMLFPIPTWGFSRFSPIDMPIDLLRRLVDDCSNVVSIKAEGGMPHIMGPIEVHRAFHEEVVISFPMEHEFIPLAQLIDVPFCGTNFSAFFGSVLPRIATMLRAGRFDEATAEFYRIDPARKAFASVPQAGNGLINRMMWKYEGWLQGYNGGPLRHPTARVYQRDMMALRRGQEAAGLNLTSDPDEFLHRSQPCLRCIFMDMITPLPFKDPSLLRQAMLIGGNWVQADSGEMIDVRNPATGALIARVPNGGAAETARAIAAADAAMAMWRTTLAKDRATILRRLYDLMLANIDDLALLITSEQGKPLSEGRGELLYAASFIEWFSEEAKRVNGEIVPQNMQGRRILVQKAAVGVFAAITPWNFPAAMITRKAGPGWAAGCAAVIKPASQTPLTALALGVLAERAGLPAGVCNIVTGSARAIGGELTASPVVRKLSFTGSTEIGALLLKQCAPTIKRTSMELGGNAPFIVFDDADLETAVKAALVAKYRNGGQSCIGANRFLVQASIHDAFVTRLAEETAKLKVAEGTVPDADIGPLIDAAAVAKVEEHVADALAKGARLVAGGKRHALGGTFFEPTVLAGVPRAAKIFDEETFGPVAPVFRFETEAEAVAMANDTSFGLAAYICARDVGRIFRVLDGLEFGMVGVNEGLISTEVAPFGGIKASGLGREGAHVGIEEYLETKYVALGGL